MKEITPYLMFDGNCSKAMTFYKECLGAELHLMPYSAAPGDHPKEGGDRTMHARLQKGSLALMASDTPPGMPSKQGDNFSVTIACDSVEEIEKLFAAFSQNGKVTMPLDDVFWGARFGMLTDQFGINWMFNFDYPKKP